MKRILSLGAGVQSTCVLLMSCRGVLPKLDAAVFADTQWEPREVYKHLAFLEAEAAGCGIPVHRTTRGDLRADAVAALERPAPLPGDENAGRFRWASLPLFTLGEDGKVGLIQRQCTKEYKIEPVERFIRQELLGLAAGQVAKSDSVELWFGISDDERSRQRTSTKHWQSFRYPLLTDVTSPRKDTLFGRGFSRQDCKDWIAAHGYHEAPRSACIGCPFHTDAEWLRVKDDREQWADAVAFDKSIRSGNGGRITSKAYLHRSCVPLDEVIFKPKDTQVAFVYGMGNECAGMCGV